MPAFRSVQRGHASLSPAFEEASPDGRRRWPLHLMVPLMAVLAGAYGWSYFRQPSDALPDVMAASLSKSPPKVVISASSADERLQASMASAGLQRLSLDGDSLTRVSPLLGQAEARLIEVYRLIGKGEHRQALLAAQRLTEQYPNFHLAQLVLGDLLSMQTRPVRTLGDVPDTKAMAAAEQLAALREESLRRIRALTERPPAGHVPTQFLTLAPSSRHAIAIDASRSRLYLFENTVTRTQDGSSTTALRLVGDYYISVGLSGIEKQVEGDKRTPLGVYYITSSLDPRRLPDLYGVGALPINYPNALDVQRGKTGSGIWLHGTPSEQFVRAPQASDGCVVLSNEDLDRLLRTVQIRTTPVVIAPELTWVPPAALDEERQDFYAALEAWRSARSQGDEAGLRALYSDRFPRRASLRSAASGETARAQPIDIKDMSLLKWHDSEETMVVTFGEVPQGRKRGVTRRQYWSREGGQWKIFYEGTT